MKLRYQVLLILVFLIVFVTVLLAVTHGVNVDVLNPKGVMADKERYLILYTVGLGMLVVVPVFIMLFMIAWKYRVGNTQATYTPEWGGSRLFESLWWGIPVFIIILLGIVTWQSTRELDPRKPIASTVQPITIQVVALQWKWLFIYPAQHVATVNKLQLPQNTPINFQVTADAPMNSFWIPSLSGQIYAMSGMSTQLHIMASEIGTYNGTSANISGKGFAGMKFVANVVSADDFAKWAQSIQGSSTPLNASTYETLARPSENVAQTTYALTKNDLYDTIITKYTAPSSSVPMSQKGMK